MLFYYLRVTAHLGHADLQNIEAEFLEIRPKTRSY